MRLGMLLFMWGLFKKVVIADRLGLYVDTVYDNVKAFTGLFILFATPTHTLSRFTWTSLVILTWHLAVPDFNINLTQNFNSPYLATSVADFWRRWHISFSSWILDYIFKPLQMQWRNWKNWGTSTAIFVAFIISGIWHGASWGFYFGVVCMACIWHAPFFINPTRRNCISYLG